MKSFCATLGFSAIVMAALLMSQCSNAGGLNVDLEDFTYADGTTVTTGNINGDRVNAETYKYEGAGGRFDVEQGNIGGTQFYCTVFHYEDGTTIRECD